ncbi:MAG: DUF63 family protein [archaeon]|nr:DUF63 family protein [archaeon]
MAEDFITRFFINPIINYEGYNPVNTIVYALILLAVAFLFVYPFFKKKGIKFDWQFLKAVFPYIILGSTLRVFEETYSNVFIFARSANPLELGFYLITPGIYIAVGVFAILALIFSIWTGKKLNKNSLTIFGIIGITPAIIIVLYQLTKLTHLFEFMAVFVMLAIVLGLLYIILSFLKIPIFKDKLSVMAIAGHSMDGLATFTALTFFSTFSEQHFVSNFIIQTFSPLAFVAVKVILVTVIVYLLDKEIDDKNLLGFIKILIAILGFAPGIRDTFSLGLTLLQ